MPPSPPTAPRVLAQTTAAYGGRASSPTSGAQSWREHSRGSEQTAGTSSTEGHLREFELRSSAVTEAYRRWCHSLERTAQHITLNRADAADVVQDAFLRALERMPSLGSFEEIFGWLSVAVRRMAIDHVRRQRVRRHRDIHPELLSSPNTHELQRWRMSMHVDTADILTSASLPMELLTVCLLRYNQRLSYAEIARRLDIPRATVGSRLHRAILLLRKSVPVAVFDSDLLGSLPTSANSSDLVASPRAGHRVAGVRSFAMTHNDRLSVAHGRDP